jgi:CHASE3 domain sensor protein
MAEMLEMTRLLRRLVGFSVAALVIVTATLGGFYVLERRAQEQYLEKREVSRIARSAAALATDRETSIRGYVLTRDENLSFPSASRAYSFHISSIP